MPADPVIRRPTAIRTRLLTWFDRQQRSLPWRRRRSLYGTWISEVMLQQTTVATVVPYWESFMATFPDVASLAAADQEEVLKMWSGLGYYRRARQLHQAARMVVSRNGGRLPRDRQGWLELPGIGPYASGAIASIGLQERVPALDANARRVLTRWLAAGPQDLAALTPAGLTKAGEDLVDPDRPGDWNEAVMELGALICRAADPACGACPVADLCRAGAAGQAHLVPPPRKAVTTEKVLMGVLVLSRGPQVFLMPPGAATAVLPPGSPAPVRKDLSGLHQGLWGLPTTAWLPDPGDPGAVWPGTIWRPWFKETFGVRPGRAPVDPLRVGGFRHAVTRYRLRVQVYHLKLAAGRAGGADRGVRGRFCRWPDTDRPVSNLVRKSLLIAFPGSV
jgi:A/G-specific adenine glycosylase